MGEVCRKVDGWGRDFQDRWGGRLGILYLD